MKHSKRGHRAPWGPPQRRSRGAPRRALHHEPTALVPRPLAAGQAHDKVGPPTPLNLDPPRHTRNSKSIRLIIARPRGISIRARTSGCPQTEFLVGCEIEWVNERRNRLQEDHLHALQCIAAAGLHLGESALPESERAARSLIELSPYRESGYRLLMEALEARGQRPAWRRCVSTLPRSSRRLRRAPQSPTCARG
jgi:Bacterial transcriptional activator domain